MRDSAASESGMTILEVMVVVGIIGVLSAMAVPNVRAWLVDQRLKTSARMVADAMNLARGEAIRTGNNHIVFLGSDIDGLPLLSNDGNPQVKVLDDGAPATADCAIGAGEPQRDFRVETDVALGVVSATAAHPLDTGDGTYSDGFTFVQPSAGSPEATWVLFGPDGIPVGLTDTCVRGTTGSGGGAVYLQNGRREFAIVLTPLGGARVSGWEAGEGAWD